MGGTWSALKAPKTARDRIAWLKEKHGLGSNAAWWIADHAYDKATWDGSPEVYLKQAADYVEAMFVKGKRAAAAHLRNGRAKSVSSARTRRSARARR